MPGLYKPKVELMSKTGKMAIVERQIGALRPYRKNSRTHSDGQVSQIMASIKEFGFTNPILISADGEVIAGHGRLQAAGRLGLETVPCVVLDHLTPSQRRAYVIADNKLALNAGWDDSVLAEELESLLADGFDLDLTGFDASEIDKLLQGELITIGADDDDDGASGSQSIYLSWGKNKVAMTSDEASGLDRMLSRYGAQSGVFYGFVSSLIEARSDHGA